MSKTETEKNYSEAQEQRIRDAATANGGRINNDIAIDLAAEFGKDVRSVRAKAVRMDLYAAKPKQSVNGGAVESKDDIVADIAALVNRNMDGLEKAPKEVLKSIRTALTPVEAVAA